MLGRFVPDEGRMRSAKSLSCISSVLPAANPATANRRRVNPADSVWLIISSFCFFEKGGCAKHLRSEQRYPRESIERWYRSIHRYQPAQGKERLHPLPDGRIATNTKVL